VTRAALGALLLAGCLASLPALADEPSGANAGAAVNANANAEANARELFRQGNLLIEQSRYLEALDAFRGAYSAWQNPKIQLNIATTLRALERRAAAIDAYQEYLRAADPPPERRAEVEAILRDLDGLVAHVKLTLPGDTRRVVLDGTPLPADAAAELSLDPGHHLVVAETGAGTRSLPIDVRAGERRDVVIAASEPPAPASAPPALTAPPLDSAPETQRGALALGITTRVDIDVGGHGAIGAAGLALGFGPHLRASLGGLFGAHAGAWAGLELSVFDAPVTPTLGVSVPVFLVDGPRVGVSGELGVRWEVSHDFLFLSARAALVHFPSVPDAYDQTAFVPSIGTEMRL
jgi:hypothetical protein